VFFLDADGHFLGVNEFKAKDDGEAILLAQRLFLIHRESVERTGGFELWHHDRLVHKGT